MAPSLQTNVRANVFLWLGQKGTGLFPFELKGTAVFGLEPKLTGKKKFAPKLSVRTPDSRGKCGFEVQFRKKIDRVFKAISIQQNAFSGNFRDQSPIGALWAPFC